MKNKHLIFDDLIDHLSGKYPRKNLFIKDLSLVYINFRVIIIKESKSSKSWPCRLFASGRQVPPSHWLYLISARKSLRKDSKTVAQLDKTQEPADVVYQFEYHRLLIAIQLQNGRSLSRSKSVSLTLMCDKLQLPTTSLDAGEANTRDGRVLSGLGRLK